MVIYRWTKENCQEYLTSTRSGAKGAVHHLLPRFQDTTPTPLHHQLPTIYNQPLPIASHPIHKKIHTAESSPPPIYLHPSVLLTTQTTKPPFHLLTNDCHSHTTLSKTHVIHTKNHTTMPPLLSPPQYIGREEKQKPTPPRAFWPITR